MATYTRQEPTSEQAQEYIRYAQKFVTQKSRPDLIKCLAILMTENATLTQECNQHRAARDFDLLPIYAPPS